MSPRPRTDETGRPNDPSTLILTSLADGEKHGYALLTDIEQFAGVRLGPGTLYGAIGRLEERGLIEATEISGRRRPYRLTATGAATLRATVEEMTTIATTATTRLAGTVALGGAGA